MFTGKAWYAIEVAARQEKFVCSLLAQKGYEAWTPTWPKVSQLRGRGVKSEQAVFPGYLFGCFDATRRLPVLTTTGVRRIVGYRREPVPIPDPEVECLKTVFRSGRLTNPCDYLRTGELVRITRGPLEGVEGVLLELKGEYQVVVSVHLLQRSLRVQLCNDAIEVIGCDRASTLRVLGVGGVA